MEYAYSLLTVTKADDGLREITGLATTPALDSQGDIVEPKGANFKLPLPLLYEHDRRQPIGHVLDAAITATGIIVRAKLVKITEPGPLKDRLDTVWLSIRHGLVRGLSIGFLPGDSEPLRSGGRRYKSWRWAELSTVVCPANVEATISAVKSAARAQRKPEGPALPVVYLNGAPRRRGAVYLDL